MDRREPDLRWTAALEAVGAVRGDPVEVYLDLAARHDVEGRHHHRFEHASAVVDAVLSLHREGEEWATPVLAAWFHDAVYDPTVPPGANEGASAVLAARVLTNLGAALSRVAEVARLIAVTADHDPPPHDRSGCLLTDADLAVLGALDDDYDAYAAAVRAEYAHVQAEAWRIGRAAVLRDFLGRPTIYRTTEGRSRWERRARSNISRELESLTR